MLTLSLLRHAKSSWDHPSLADRDRPLAPRGRRASKTIAEYLQRQAITPSLVLCSSARRTRDTLALVLPELKIEPKVVYENRLYHPSPAELLQRVREIPPGASRVIIVGHNPELHSFALDLVGAGPKHFRDRLREKFPTAALAVINFPSGLWSSIAVNSGTLNLFLAPKDLRA